MACHTSQRVLLTGQGSSSLAPICKEALLLLWLKLWLALSLWL